QTQDPPAAPATPATSPWTLRVGPALAAFHASSRVSVAGSPVPGAAIDLKDNVFLGIDIGYALDAHWTLRTALGVPPTTTLSAAGSLAGLVPPLTGTLGHVKYGPAVLSLVWSPGAVGPLRPYVGAGLNYTHVFSSSDGDIAGLRVRSAFGTALQAGVELPIGAQWSWFIDARQIFVKTRATGTVPALGGPPARADVRLDPLVLHLGLSHRF
ncbi:MAG: outer membrane protein precursor, partial [Pseudomonadota bacterium]